MQTSCRSCPRDPHEARHRLNKLLDTQSLHRTQTQRLFHLESKISKNHTDERFQIIKRRKKNWFIPCLPFITDRADAEMRLTDSGRFCLKSSWNETVQRAIQMKVFSSSCAGKYASGFFFHSLSPPPLSFSTDRAEAELGFTNSVAQLTLGALRDNTQQQTKYVVFRQCITHNSEQSI